MTDITNDTTPTTPEDVSLDDFSADFFAADKVEDKRHPEDSETSHEDDDESNPADETSEADDDEGESDDEPETKAEDDTPKGKKKSRFQERIDDLTAKMRERERLEAAADARAAAAEERLAAALAKLEELAPEKPKAEAPQNTPKTPDGLVEPTADDLNEDGSPKYALGEFDPKYLRDLTRYDRAVERAREAEVAEQARAEKAKMEELTSLQNSWNDKVTSAKDVYPDYVEKGETLLSELSDIPQETAIFLTTSIMEMEYGPDVFYYLAEHPEEARAIAESSPQRALNRLGRIEARFEIAANDRSGKETKLRTSNAPPPAPRNKGSNATAPKIDLADASLDDFEREFFRKK